MRWCTQALSACWFLRPYTRRYPGKGRGIKALEPSGSEEDDAGQEDADRRRGGAEGQERQGRGWWRGRRVWRRRQKAERVAEAAAAVLGAGGGGRLRSAGAGRGGEQGLGLHQAAPAAERGGPPRDPGRRQASGGGRHEEGDHVRDEQAPCPAPEVNHRGAAASAIGRRKAPDVFRGRGAQLVLEG